ncbi:hypothetical protein Fot_40194 [Forsythia ovata]|uniref:Uncharacterized protein n=1 Tax=Forsythia ovata TaxID=205694 RepID=A0ABD1S6S0_9LAMI
MDLDRPHFRSASTSSNSISSTYTTSELFICFASRLTSSSYMKFSKSILSPGRARDGSISLSTSLSRRLRTNGSLKGGQASPFFTNNGKKRGCAFENPEPSSPKVTCIGQVRVKTKKKVKQTPSLSRKGNGEVGLRKLEQGQGQSADVVLQNEERICIQPQQSHSNVSAHYQHQQAQECLSHRNQRWVHLPITICESLSCLFPCKSSCFSTSERDKAEKLNGSRANEDGQSSCGAVFTRWLVSLNDGEGGKRREIELVVGGGDEEERTEVREKMLMRSSRRHVFEDIEIKDDRIEIKGQVIEGEEEEEAAREHVKASPICNSSPSTESDKEETASSEEVALFEEAQEIIIFEDSEENAQIKLEPEDEQKSVTAIPIESETNEPENQETIITASEKDKENQGLPECLLLMMCEPKLSMEVSKETWVCKTDFIRWLPERQPKKPTNGACDHEPIKKRVTNDSKPKPIAPPAAEKNSEDNPQPRRSSCSLPATSAVSMATMIEQKLVNAVSYEPLELTRCKSEPMKTAAAKLMPESCFWKNTVGKLEPYRQATVGVGAAGVEF